jgi:carbon-monoxide dehydrogenase medium subunit
MIPAQFDYLAPVSVEEAIRALAEHGDDAKVLAGGQSLLPILRMRLNAPGVVIDLGRIPELQGVSEDGDHLVIGAMTTYAAVLASEAVSTHAALLSKAIQAGSPVNTEGERDAAPHFDEGAPNQDPASGASEGSGQ